MSERVFVAIGSNLGDRIGNISAALRMMRLAHIKVVDTGFLYQSDPMYLLEQPPFLNTVIEARTSLSPDDLLHALKHIEAKVGRVKSIKNGPRSIDLDIVLYGDAVIETPDLLIPHPRMCERAFVLVPLSDMDGSIVHPIFRKSISELLALLPSNQGCHRVFPSGLPDNVWDFSKRSLIAGILNVTPDSFSDGGLFSGVQAAVNHARRMIADGADIVDVGGESTRPTATSVEVNEEIKRVADVIANIRKEFPLQAISVDTYKAATARAAVAAGACIVNDVSGGMLDADMLATVAEVQVPYILTHAGRIGVHSQIDYNDGNPSVLTSDMSEDEIVRILKAQLLGRVTACRNAGIPRWAIVLDPGLGFGKSGSVNFTIIRRLDEVFSGPLAGFPVMVGASRKRFVCDLKQDGSDYSCTNQEALLGTVAVTVASRAPLHRVHDVAAIRRVLDVTDRIYRSP